MHNLHKGGQVHQDLVIPAGRDGRLGQIHGVRAGCRVYVEMRGKGGGGGGGEVRKKNIQLIISQHFTFVTSKSHKLTCYIYSQH